jgi:hypothetical protein
MAAASRPIGRVYSGLGDEKLTRLSLAVGWLRRLSIATFATGPKIVWPGMFVSAACRRHGYPF